MVNILSKIIAIIITLAVVIVLYPLSAILWVLGLIGKLGEKMFKITNSIIKKLWSEITSTTESVQFQQPKTNDFQQQQNDNNNSN